MSKRTIKSKKTRQVGPQIVRAWFDTVLNPLIRALEAEQEWLAKMNPTWRFQPSGLEALRHIRAHLDPWAWDNAEQFFEFYPEVKKAALEHDESVNLLTDSCRRLQQVIVESSDLREVYHRTTSADSLATLNTTLQNLFGSYPEEDHLALLAQHVVNNTGELFGYYTTSTLWNKYKDEFLAILHRPSIRGQHEETFEQIRDLQARTEKLARLLREKRLELSLEHDVPYVTPVTTTAGLPYQSFR